MKKIILGFFLLIAFLLTLPSAQAADRININLPPTKCYLDSCPSDLLDIYKQRNEKCVSSYEEFLKNPGANHYWIDDPEITAQGKANDRARQFIWWVINKNAIDDHQIFKDIWQVTRRLSYYFLLVSIAIVGIGFIIGQTSNFNLNIKIMPWLIKIGLTILYITFSATIVIILIQLSEIISRFFVEKLGGSKLFNIYFSDIPSSEKNYNDFIGCRDLNFQVQEAIQTELFLLKTTNITYYVMGIMLIMRKIILWSMIIISPFLGILFLFNFIKNIGWIWIGVFFQWLFYGPLFSLFLGATARIWQAGIPFTFNFSRAGTSKGYVYYSGINLLFGGPAQKLSVLNNGNYIDTFMEYVISLIMLWVTIFLPWWLLRIFRDYCCDGINTSKNILLSIYDHLRGKLGPISPLQSAPQTVLKANKEIDVNIKPKLINVEQVKKITTEEIKKTITATTSTAKLTNLANYETNKQVKETVNKNLSYLQNPTQASTPKEKEMFMNLKNELYHRSIKNDTSARQILLSVSNSLSDQILKKQQILSTLPTSKAINYVVAYRSQVNPEKVNAINNYFVDSLLKNADLVSEIAQTTHLSSAQTQSLLISLKENISQPATEVIENIAKKTSLNKETLEKTLQLVYDSLKTNPKLTQLLEHTATGINLPEKQLREIIADQIKLILASQKNIEEIITIPPSISLEDYEQVKKMWKEQYQKGEVPVSENIQSRLEWIEKDIVFITNTLNKLVASDPNLKQQGLDDLAYILPVVLINNLKGEEIIVYLKAKLEAAKTVKEEIEKEQAVIAKTKQEILQEEELITVAKTTAKKAENTKTMTMQEEKQESSSS
jgi:hypothetical protein